MAVHQINGLSYGNISYKNSQGTIQNVQAIYYKHSNGEVTLIWPDQYWAGNVVLLDTTIQDTIDYSFVNGEPVYTRNGATLSGLIPGHNYIITGTINRGNGMSFPAVSGCYFSHVTGSSVSNMWYNGIGTASNPSIVNPFTGNADAYTTYQCDDRLVSSSSDLDARIVLKYNVPDAQTAGISFIGYGYGSTNFENATPVILRRIPITGTIMFFDGSNNTVGNGGTISSLSVGQSITVWPKVYKYGTGYSTYEAVTGTFTGGTGYLNVVDNNDGSYTITATNASNNTVSLSFSYTIDQIPSSGTLDLGVVSGVDYRIKIGNGSWIETAGAQSSINVSEVVNITAEQSNDGGNSWSSYSGTISVTTGNSALLQVISNNGYQLKPSGTGSTTLTITIDGVNWTWTTVNTTYNLWLVYNLSDSGNETFTQFNSNATVNVTSTGPFVLGFSTSNQTLTSELVDVRTSSNVQGVQKNPGGSSWTSTDTITITPTQSASGNIVYDVSLDGATTYYTITFNVNVS